MDTVELKEPERVYHSVTCSICGQVYDSNMTPGQEQCTTCYVASPIERRQLALLMAILARLTDLSRLTSLLSERSPL